MTENVVLKAIKRVALEALLIPLIIIIAIGVLGFTQRYYLSSKLYGIQEVEGAIDAEGKYDSGRRYVQLYADALYDTGIEVETTNKTNGITVSKKITSFFMMVEFEDKLMLVELPAKYDDQVPEDGSDIYTDVMLEGTLVKADDDVIEASSEFLASVFEVEQELITDEILSPVMLEVRMSNDMIDQSIYVFAFLLVITLAFIVKNFVHWISPRTHKAYRALGEFGDQTEVEEEIQRELSDEQTILARTNKDYITKKYIIAPSGKRVVWKTEELIWAYLHSVTRKGVTNHYVMLKFKNGSDELQLSVKNEDEGNAIMEALYVNLPIIIGYTKEYKKAYNKDMEQFMIMVEEYLKQKEEAAKRAEEQHAEESKETESEQV